MGQHKYNETALLAKQGKIPPRPPRLTKRQREEIARRLIWESTFGISKPNEVLEE